MSRIEESLYRVSGIKLYESFNTYELINSLIDKFGKDFNTKPICSEVCDFIEYKYPELKKVECSVYIKDGTDFIPISTNHSVIKVKNKILDFTNQQYNNYEEYGNNTDIPRVFEKLKNNIYVNDNMFIKV